MAKPLQDADYLQYQKQLADFMAAMNPKPSLEDVEKLKQQYLARKESK